MIKSNPSYTSSVMTKCNSRPYQQQNIVSAIMPDSHLKPNNAITDSREMARGSERNVEKRNNRYGIHTYFYFRSSAFNPVESCTEKREKAFRLAKA